MVDEKDRMREERFREKKLRLKRKVDKMRKSQSTTTAALSEDVTSVRTRGTLTSSKKKKKLAENETFIPEQQRDECLSAIPKRADLSPHAPLTLSSFTSKSLAEPGST